MDRVKENEIYDKFQDLCNSYKDIILSDDKHLCNTECPLRDTNRCENVFFYQQGAREFAEWLQRNDAFIADAEFDSYKPKLFFGSVESALAEWQKGAEDGRITTRNNRKI